MSRLLLAATAFLVADSTVLSLVHAQINPGGAATAEAGILPFT